MKLLSLLLVLLLVGGILPAKAQHVPAKSPKCGQRILIKAPKNGGGVFFNQDCSVAYVLPPAEASVDVRGVSPSANAQRCPVVNGRYSYAQGLQKRMEALIASVSPAQPYDPEDPFSTKPPEVDYKKIDEEAREIMKLQDEIYSSLDSYAKLEAATVQVVFNSQHPKTVEDYAKLNPRMAFLPMPIKTSALSFTRKDTIKPESLPAVLEVAVPGITYVDPTLTGDPLPDPKEEAKRYSNEKNNGLVFSNALSGQLTLSLIGGCPFYDSRTGSVNPRLSGSEMTSNLIANVSYAYDLQAYAKYKASFNLASLVRRMQKSTTSGGLFFTSSAVEIINEKDSSDWFEFKSEADDSDLQIAVTAQEVKADLIDRVIKQIGHVAIEGSGRIPDPAAPPVHGATVAANELQKCLHIYCQAAAIGLRILDSIFGSSEASQKFIASSNYTATDVVESRRMIRFRGSYTFVPKERL